MSWQLAAVAGFYGVVLGTGILAARRNDSSAVSLLVAGRRLPLVVGALTMTATWVGGGYINGTAEVVFNVGSEGGGLIWAQATWAYAVSLVLGGLFFARRMRRAGYVTLLDPFEQRYGKTTAALLSIPALIGEVFWSAAILAALGMTFGVLLGFDVTTAILVSAAIAAAYTVVGGLWAVAYTDVVQVAFILLGLLLAIPFALSYAGGLQEVVVSYASSMQGFPTGALRWRWFDFALLLCLGGIPWQVYFQRVLACRDERSAMRLSLIAAGGCIVLALPAVLIGAIGATVWSDGGGPESAALVLPQVLLSLTPAAVATVGLAAVAAAVMSSVDSSILSASTLFAWNVYRPLTGGRRSDREMRWVVRVGVVAVCGAAAWLALRAQSVYVLWVLCADLVYVVLFPQLVMVLFWRHANRTGALAGAAMALALRVGGGEAELGLGAFIAYSRVGEVLPVFGSEFPFRTFSMLGGLATIAVVSLLTRHRDPPCPVH